MSKHLFIAALLIFSVSGCKKLNTSVNNLSGGKIAIIGHGGGGIPGFSTTTQLNSFDGMMRAITYYNTDGVETDIQLTNDSVLFMFHDDHLDDLSYCTGCVNSYNAQALAQCTFKQANDGDKAVENVTPLETLISTLAQRTIHPTIFLDMHIPNSCVDSGLAQTIYFQRSTREIDRLMKKYNAQSWICIQSISHEWLLYAKNTFPYMKVFLDYATGQADIDFATANKFYGIAAETGSFTADNVTSAHRNGLYVQLYGANAQGDIVTAFNKSPDYFLADDIVLAEQVAKNLNTGE